MKPYGLVSDVHLNSWSMFSSVDEKGRNTRLMGIISELERCEDEVLKAGGDTVFCAGDFFHKRGSVEPEVFNPVRDYVRRSGAKGIKLRGISGNHDLASRQSVALQSSVEMLNQNGDFYFYHAPRIIEDVLLFPWIDNPQEYKRAIAEWAEQNKEKAPSLDLICHIGIDGTLKTMPDHDVGASFFADLPFKRVFSGHYHNHKDFGNGVYSIGATTHQTWGDVGTKAGFLIVSEDEVVFHESLQPKFVHIDGTKELANVKEIKGNYVQVKIGTATNKEIQEARKTLESFGAKGVSVIASAAKTSEREVSVSKLSSVDENVMAYCTDNKLPKSVSVRCMDILKEVRK